MGSFFINRVGSSVPDEICDEVVKIIETLGENAGYICSPDHHIKPDVPLENVKVLFDTALEYPVDNLYK